MRRRFLLPDVVIGGAPRSGTTFLCEMLAKHPQVHVARPLIPEPKVLMMPNPCGIDGFAAHYASIFGDAPSGRILIEKTSYYLENDDARRRFAAVLPRTRVLFILRNPVRRAYSNWLWSTRNGLETLSFREAIALEGKRLSPLPPERSYARPFDYVSRGAYGKHLQAWIDAIGHERIGVFQFEDAIERPEWFGSQIQKFVCVEPLPWSALETGIVNATERNEEDWDLELEREIRCRLAHDMRKLSQISNIDITRWGF